MSIGPFAIDTYLPAFHEIARDLHTSELAIQHSLTAYLFAFTVMTLFHGALADAFGRKTVAVTALLVFLLASIAAACAMTSEQVWVARVCQGLSAGAGSVVARAIARDLYEGPLAQRVLASGATYFALAPAVAPIVGGLLLAAWGWRAIFVFLALYALALILTILWWLPESLPVQARRRFELTGLLRGYADVFRNVAFLRLAITFAASLLGFFLYVMSAPAFLINHLHVSPQAFAWLFVPTVAGTMLGSAASGRLATRMPPTRCMRLGIGIMAAAALGNVSLNLLMAPSLPWVVLPVLFYTFGMAIASPAVQIMVLDLYPQRRGLVSSCLGFVQSLANALAAATLVPGMGGDPLWMALAMAVICLVATLAATQSSTSVATS